MLTGATVYSVIREQGLRFFAGVPDSLLKDFCAYVTDHAPKGDHVIAANEGNAVALAMGHFLGTGEPGLVYMQNSGVGNAVNPLLSLVDPEVYSIPMLLVIGWRGEPGVKDEPQHVKQGRRMTELLDAMEVPWFLLPPTPEEARSTIVEA
jgi:phosphonopyruvate decarboxylase